MYYKLPIILKYCSLLLDAYNARKNASIIYSGPIGGMENPVALMHPTMVTWALSPDPAAQATLPCMVTPFGGFGSSGIPLSSILKICPVFPVRWLSRIVWSRRSKYWDSISGSEALARVRERETVVHSVRLGWQWENDSHHPLLTVLCIPLLSRMCWTSISTSFRDLT